MSPKKTGKDKEKGGSKRLNSIVSEPDSDHVIKKPRRTIGDPKGSGESKIYSKRGAKGGTYKTEGDVPSDSDEEVNVFALGKPPSKKNDPYPDLVEEGFFLSSVVNPKISATQQNVGTRNVWTHDERVATLFGVLRTNGRTSLESTIGVQGPHTLAHVVTTRVLEAATAYSYEELQNIDNARLLNSNTLDKALVFFDTGDKKTLTAKDQAENLLNNMKHLVLTPEKAEEKMKQVVKSQEMDGQWLESYSSAYKTLYTNLTNNLKNITEDRIPEDEQNLEQTWRKILTRYRQLLEIEPYGAYALGRFPADKELAPKDEKTLNQALINKKPKDLLQNTEGPRLLDEAIDTNVEEIPKEEFIEFGTRKLAFVVGPQTAKLVVQEMAKEKYKKDD